LIGENRGTEHTFGVYKPRGKHEAISNLLAKGIVNEDGSPGPHFALAQQFSVTHQPLFYIGAPQNAKVAYDNRGQMPQPNTAGTPSAQSSSGPPFSPAALAGIAAIDPNPDFNANTDTILTTGFSNLA
jgi:phospholipase C